jgi:enoyl-CoA hydratase/carnithine racemase
MTELTTSFVEAGVSGAIGHLEICRPEKKNAMSSAMAEDLLRALLRLEDDAECRAIVLSGRGGDLSSGADLDEPRDPAAARRSWANAPAARLLRAIAAARLPVVAVVDGWAIGLGLGLVGAATHAVAGRASRLALPEIKSGYLPYAVLPHLGYRTPAETVLRWAVSGAVFTVDEAAAAGLVTHVAESGSALVLAHDLAASFAAAPRALVEEGMAFVRESRSVRGSMVRWCERQMDVVLARDVDGGANE